MFSNSTGYFRPETGMRVFVTFSLFVVFSNIAFNQVLGYFSLMVCPNPKHEERFVPSNDGGNGTRRREQRGARGVEGVLLIARKGPVG